MASTGNQCDQTLLEGWRGRVRGGEVEGEGETRSEELNFV